MAPRARLTWSSGFRLVRERGLMGVAEHCGLQWGLRTAQTATNNLRLRRGGWYLTLRPGGVSFFEF